MTPNRIAPAPAPVTTSRRTAKTSDQTQALTAPLATPASVTTTALALREELLEQVDLCHLLKLSRTTIYRLRLQHKFPDPIVVGQVVRWRASDVATWLAAQPTVSLSDSEIAELS